MKIIALLQAMLMFMLFAGSPAFAAKKTVDVLVVYPNQATTVTQGRDIPALAASYIEYANQTYINSNVDIKLRLVHLRKVSISGTGSVSSTALQNLAKNQQIGGLRTQYGADLVVLLTLRKNVSGGFLCGIGYVPQGAGGKFYWGAKSGGYSVSAVNCGNPTFVHELGHNMGLGHSYAQGSQGGIYSWGRGHGKYNNFATTMAYPQAYGSAVRVQQFSSPSQYKCNYSVCGIQQNLYNGADAVTSLNTVAKQVSDFYPTKVASTSVGAAPDSPATSTQTNLVTNGNFDVLGSWSNFWGRSSFQRSSTKVSSKYGLKVSNRQVYYAGPVQNVPLKVGNSYRLSAHVTLGTPFSARATMRAALLLYPASGGLNIQPLSSVSIVPGQWSKINTTFKVSGAYGKLNKIELLFYGPSGGWDFYLDEVVIKP
jgi:hypothetical protein